MKRGTLKNSVETSNSPMIDSTWLLSVSKHSEYGRVSGISHCMQIICHMSTILGMALLNVQTRPSDCPSPGRFYTFLLKDQTHSNDTSSLVLVLPSQQALLNKKQNTIYITQKTIKTLKKCIVIFVFWNYFLCVYRVKDVGLY